MDLPGAEELSQQEPLSSRLGLKCRRRGVRGDHLGTLPTRSRRQPLSTLRHLTGAEPHACSLSEGKCPGADVLYTSASEPDRAASVKRSTGAVMTRGGYVMRRVVLLSSGARGRGGHFTGRRLAGPCPELRPICGWYDTNGGGRYLRSEGSTCTMTTSTAGTSGASLPPLTG